MEEIKKLVSPYFVDWQTEVEITAVLKYIRINGGKINMQEKTDWNAMYIKVEYLYLWDDDYDYYHIPNKPLSLYDVQQEEQLLDLLIKLKEQWT